MRHYNPGVRHPDPYEYVIFATDAWGDPWVPNRLYAPYAQERAIEEALRDGLIVEFDDGWELTMLGRQHLSAREQMLGEQRRMAAIRLPPKGVLQRTLARRKRMIREDEF